MPALPSLPCSAITGRSCPLWPGGMEITQLVLMPPRAAEMNEPEILVGKLLPAVGGSNGAGAACGLAGPPGRRRPTRRRLPRRRRHPNGAGHGGSGLPWAS